MVVGYHFSQNQTVRALEIQAFKDTPTTVELLFPRAGAVLSAALNDPTENPAPNATREVYDAASNRTRLEVFALGGTSNGPRTNESKPDRFNDTQWDFAVGAPYPADLEWYTGPPAGRKDFPTAFCESTNVFNHSFDYEVLCTINPVADEALCPFKLY